MRHTTYSSDRLIGAVRAAYSAAAEQPDGRHAFPVGRRFAESVGYPSDLLDSLPERASAVFAGVSCVSLSATLEPGMRVLDLGCGGGLDALVAAQRVGCNGHVTGVDFSESMLECARRARDELGVANVDFRLVDADELPCDDATFDVALVNGLFNLNPDRGAIFVELSRVVRPLGNVFAAELVLCEPRSESVDVDEASWFA